MEKFNNTPDPGGNGFGRDATVFSGNIEYPIMNMERRSKANDKWQNGK
jgi:hypothetical protein